MIIKNFNIWYISSLIISVAVAIPILTICAGFFEGTSKYYSILKDKDESYRIFEEYVNGGFDYLFEFSKDYSDEIEFVDSLLELVRKKSLDNEVFEDPVVENELDLNK